MNRRTFLTATAAASATAVFQPLNAEAALPQAKIVKEGKLYPNDRPGLGVTVNMDRLRPVVTISEPGPNRPRMTGPDGSQITW